MKKFKVTDQRVIEACGALLIDIDKASPRERFEAYCQWTFGDGSWGDVLIDVLKGCGATVKS